MFNKQQTEKMFQTMFKGGVLERLPKNKQNAEVFLALPASAFDPQRSYTESEINDRLVEWMEGFAIPVSMDYVTVRRYLVDDHFLSRDASGGFLQG